MVALGAAKAQFDCSTVDVKDKKSPELKAANDNSPLIELCRRLPDLEQRLQFIETANHIRQLQITVATDDASGFAVHRPGKSHTADFGVERPAVASHANKLGEVPVMYGYGQRLDRYDYRKDEKAAGPFSGKPRIVAKSSPMIAYDPARDQLFVERRHDARIELDQIIAAVGPIWPHFDAMLSGNATATEVGEMTGAKGTQAPGVGTAIVRIALNAATQVVRELQQNRSYREYVSGLEDHQAVPAILLKKALRTAQAA